MCDHVCFVREKEIQRKVKRQLLSQQGVCVSKRGVCLCIHKFVSEILNAVVSLWPLHSNLFTFEVACCDPLKWIIVMSATAGHGLFYVRLQLHNHKCGGDKYAGYQGEFGL